MTRSDFAGRRAVVTGAGSGIGEAIVAGLLHRGAAVVALDLDTGRLTDATENHRVDVSDPDAVAGVCASVLAGGPVDVLFNNAGIGSTATVVDCAPDEWDRVMAVNVRSVYLMTRHLLPAMLEAGHGAIVNTASAAATIGLRDRAAYCASKGAVVALTKQIATQWAAHGIRANSISPGTVDSPWIGRLLDEAADPAALREQLVARQPMQRLGLPTEIAEAALFLGSDRAAFVTGTDFLIDGGITAGR